MTLGSYLALGSSLISRVGARQIFLWEVECVFRNDVLPTRGRFKSDVLVSLGFFFLSFFLSFFHPL